MSDDEFAAIIGAADQQMAQQLARAQACLDLFEKDCGRRANTVLDIRVWADAQVPENLRFRILRRVRTAQLCVTSFSPNLAGRVRTLCRL